MSGSSGIMACDGCGKPNPTMQCPTCKQLSHQPSYFCSQSCFVSNWPTHRQKHSEKPACTITTMTSAMRDRFEFRGTLRPHLITPTRFVPSHIARPDYANHPQGRSHTEEVASRQKIVIYTPKQLTEISNICKLSREVLECGMRGVTPGITTDELDRIVHEATVERGLYPSPLNYYGFPKSVCTSVNEIICHGIPDSRELEEGDIVNLDVTCFNGTHHGDLNETVFVGRPEQSSTIELVHHAYKAMNAGIKAVGEGGLYRHIGNAIEAYVRTTPHSIVRTYTGHGIGQLFHTTPTVPHYARAKEGNIIKTGHVFTIEPMINEGDWRDVTWPDNWTASTVDGKLSAQFEHTLAVMNKGNVRILTKRNGDKPFYQEQLEQWGIELPE